MVELRNSRRQRAGANVQSVTLPAPTGGWNARDPLDAMPVQDAIQMDNFVPGTAAVSKRAGSKEHATDLGAPVETLASFADGTTTRLLAGVNGEIKDVTDGNNVASLGSGYASDRWQWANMNGRLAFVNGHDQPQVFDGSTLSDLTFDLFDDDASDTTDWTLGTGWSHDSTNDALDHATGNTATLKRSIVNLGKGVVYRLWLEVGNRTQGDITVSFKSASAPAATFSSNAVHEITFGAVDTTDDLIVTPSSDFDGSIQNARVRRDALDPTALFEIAVFKNRSYFVQAGTQDFWFSRVNALGGDLTKFPLSRVGQFGGSLTMIVPWTAGAASDAAEGGVGIEQFIAFVMSSGEIIVYRGSDPSSVDFTLVGVYRVGAPLGPRGKVNVAGDAIVLTTDGAMPMSAVRRQGRFDATSAITDKIRQAFNTAARNHRGTFGWQALFYPSGPWLMVNVPQRAAVWDQYCMNTITGAWFRIRDWNARALVSHDNRLFYGGDGVVYEADTGTRDSTAAIDATVRQAFTPLGQSRGAPKHVRAVQPILEAATGVPFGIEVEADFKETGIPSSALINLTAVFRDWPDIADVTWSTWTQEWDATPSVPIDTEPFTRWFIRNATGQVFGIRVRAIGASGFRWLTTTVRLSSGNALI